MALITISELHFERMVRKGKVLDWPMEILNVNDGEAGDTQLIAGAAVFVCYRFRTTRFQTQTL